MFAPISFGRRYNWLSPTNAFAVAVFAMALSINAIGQTPDLRKVAATGPDYPGLEEQPVWETEIAAGSSRLIAVFNVGPRSAAPDGISRIGYAIARQSGGTFRWSTQGLITPGVHETPWAMDPDIAYDATADDFLASCVHGVGAKKGVAVARYSGSSTPFGAGWQLLTGNVDADYPHIVAGRQLANGKREFWITYHRQSGSMALQYLYSGDGGQTWSGAPISVGSAEVIGSFAVPALGSDGALYVSYSAETPEGNEVIRFVRGEADSSNPPDISFSHLNDAGGPVTLTPLKWALTTSTPLMLQQFNGLLRAQGQIAPDPSDPNVIHIVYNDLAQADPAGEDDVEVFYRKLQRNGDNWSLSDRLAVNTNDDPAGLVTDQIRPVVVATAAPPVAGGSTWLHVLFYDDRDFPTQGEMTADAKMHLYYSYSLDGGAHWAATNRRIYLIAENPNDPPALDYTVPLHAGFQLGEYNGITLRTVGTTWEVWSSFVQMLPSGSSGEDDFSQIGAVRIPSP